MASERRWRIIRITIGLLLIFSLFHVVNYNEEVTKHVTGSSTWVQDNETFSEISLFNNTSLNSNGEIVLRLQNKYFRDDFFNTTNISYRNDVIVDTHAGAVRPFGINKTFGGNKYDYGNDVIEASDGGYILVGTTSSFTKNYYDVWLIKTDGSGNMKWNKTFGGVYYDEGYAVDETSDGGCVIVGSTASYGMGYNDIWLIKTDENGDMEWNTTFGGEEDDFGYSVQQTSDDGFIIVGTTYSFGSGASDAWVIKTNEHGRKRHDGVYGGSHFDEGVMVSETKDGGFIVFGSTASFGEGSYDIWLIKTDEYCVKSWERTVGSNNYDWGSSFEPTADGGYIISGVFGDIGYVIIKTDYLGRMQWNKTYECEIRSVIQTADGGYAFIGYSESHNTFGADIWMVKTDSNGDMEWNRSLNYGASDWGHRIRQTSDGGYIVVGYTIATAGYSSLTDIWLVKTNQLGELSRNGSFISIDVPTLEKASSIHSFEYNASIPDGSEITVQFSMDNQSWYNSKSVINRSNLLKNGTNFIKLSGNISTWPIIYYQVNFASENNNVSVLHSVNISYYSYCLSGTIESQPFSSGENVYWKSIAWSSVEFSGTYTKFQLRTANTYSNLSLTNYVGPDGFPNTYYEVPGEPIWPGHEDEPWIQYRTYLTTNSANQTPILKNISIIFNRIPNPPLLQTPKQNIWLNNNKPEFSWYYNDPDSENQSSYQWQADSDINFSSIDFDSGMVTSFEFSHIHSFPMNDGVWFWRVRTQDHDSNWSAFSDNHSVKIDTIAPSISLNKVVRGGLGQPIKIVANVNDEHSGIKSVNVYFKGSSEDSYTKLSMERSGAVYSTKIPGEFIKEKKIEFYLEAIDRSTPSNKRYYGFSGEASVKPTSETDLEIIIPTKEPEQDDLSSLIMTLFILLLIIIIVIIILALLRKPAGPQVQSKQSAKPPIKQPTQQPIKKTTKRPVKRLVKQPLKRKTKSGEKSKLGE